MRTWIVFALTVIALLSMPLRAADGAGVVIAGTSITLGMSYEQVVNLLPETVSLREAWSKEGGASFYLWSKTTPNRYYGQLVFDRDRLTSIGRDWAPEAVVTAEDAARAFIAAVRSAKTANANCSASVRSSDQPMIQGSSVEITCGARTVSISLVESKGDGPRESVSIYEWVRVRR